MAQKRAENTRVKLIEAGTEVIRRQGYMATTVAQVCAAADVSKGAFFHHFRSKQDLAEACLCAWDEMGAAMVTSADFQQRVIPRDRVMGYMDLFIDILSQPSVLKSCLAGVTAQEVAETNSVLRQAANVCFRNGQARFQSLLDDAVEGTRKKPDTESLAGLWFATLQGALVLGKASQNEAVIADSLRHVQKYIVAQLPPVC